MCLTLLNSLAWAALPIAAVLWGRSRGAAGAVFPIERPRVTLPFGAVTPPYGPGSPHRGVDLAPFPGSTGRPIVAVLGGVVTRVGSGSPWFGNYVVTRVSLPRAVRAADLAGRAVTIPPHTPVHLLYAHMHEVAVSEGKRVQAGQQLGTIGSTGYAFGPHLHLELRIGDYRNREVLNPLDLLTGLIPGLADTLEGDYHV